MKIIDYKGLLSSFENKNAWFAAVPYITDAFYFT